MTEILFQAKIIQGRAKRSSRTVIYQGTMKLPLSLNANAPRKGPRTSNTGPEAQQLKKI